MSDNASINVNEAVSHECEAVGPSSASERCQPYALEPARTQLGGNDNAGRTKGLRRKLPKLGTPARDRVEARICTLWEEGKDTMYIASAVNLTEPLIYNVLWEHSR